MKTRMRKAWALLLALWLLAGTCAPRALAAGAEVVELSTVEDFLSFAKNCSLDTWSQGKTFVLTADLDLTGRGFPPIPTFGGAFLGEGHTLSGINLTGSGSDMGLFRYVQTGAVIRGLHVSGRVAPGGAAANVGGIAGSNAGSIQDCSFQGTVRGKAAVGGVVGQNEATGEVSGCTAAGTVSGEDGTGGIAGRNLGLLLKCENTAAVNTSDPDISSAGAVTGSALDQLASPNAGEEAEAILNSHTDTGGIAGYSGGVIQSCTNAGTVGYSHVGYNVGGVAGRQCGSLSDCSNSAPVYGRKDVGGIVGQAEPDIVLNTDGDTLAQLRQELNTLDALIDRALGRSDDSRADISQVLTAIGQSTGEARDHAKVLLDRTADFTDGNLDTLNTLTAAVTSALDGLVPALDDLSGASDDLDDLGRALRRGLDGLSDSGDLADSVLADAERALAALRDAGGDLSQAAQRMRTAADSLQRSVILHDRDAVKEANRQLAGSIRDLGGALQAARTALEDLERALSGGLPDDEAAQSAFQALTTALGDAGTALGAAGDALGSISDNVEIDWTEVQSALEDAGVSLDHLNGAAQDLDGAMARLEDALSGASPLLDALGSSAGQFSEASSFGSKAARHLKDAFQTLGEVADRLARDGSVSFTPLGQEARDAGDGLYSSLAGLSEELTQLQTAVDSAGDTLSGDLRAISRQITKIFNLMLDVLDSAQAVETPEDLFGDVSEEDIDGTYMGKASGCVNTGAVEGDRNVGGVAGAVAVEYSLDPEDDDPRFTFGSTYELKAILQNCVNRGAVTGRRDCVGGAAGRMDLGTAIGCQNYGSVTGTGGYVGGIAGYADAAVRECWAKCDLSGVEYVGGIAGWASRMTDCRAIAAISDGTQYVGSIAGDTDQAGTLRGNRFVDLGTAGIDGVSYAGAAEPVPFEELSAEEGAPAEFLSFTLTLTADGEVVDRIPFQFGDDLGGLELPEVPPKEGFYGAWPELDRSGVHSDLTLEAVYTPWITLLASGEAEGKQALALAEGQFTQEAALTVADSKTPPPQGAEGADVWEVSLTGAELPGDAAVPLRLLDRSGGRSTVWQLADGQWREAEFTVNGSYLCLTMDGASGVFCVQPASHGLLIPALLATIVLLLALLLFRRMRRKRTAAKRTAK